MILGTNRDKISKFIDSIEKEARALIKDVSSMAVWSSISTETIWEMTYLEREVLTEAIKEKTDLLYGKKGVARNGML